MDIFSQLNVKLTDSKRFYFLEYFYILLRSISKYSNQAEVFEAFKELKDNLLLGESKYKKLAVVSEVLTEKQIGRYKYTFSQVVDECKIYDLIETKESSFYLTKKGEDLLKVHAVQGLIAFNEEVFNLIEYSSNGFYYFVKTLYEINPNGRMIIFPIYSPLKLQIPKDSITKSKDILNYLNVLVDRLKADIEIHLKRTVDLQTANEKLWARLIESDIVGRENDSLFKPSNYNIILKRVRDYWLNHFLKEIYDLRVSVSQFDVWIYRAKQLGIINTTEFYPNFNGKIVYPVSILYDDLPSNDFKQIYAYPNGFSLYRHEPKWNTFQELFVEEIYNTYNDLKRSNRSYFINLLDLSEIVCYKLKLSGKMFVDFLEYAYQLNLKGKLRIKISLEADKLPFETKAMYLKRDPIIIDGKIRNIIAIDLINNE